MPSREGDVDQRPEDSIRVALLPESAPGFRRLAALLGASGGFELVDDAIEAEVLIVLAGEGGLPPEVEAALAPAVVLGGPRRRGERTPGGHLGQNPTAAELEAAIRAVAAGLVVYEPTAAREAGPDEVPQLLTGREREVLALMAEGLPNKGIALRLGISEHTAKFHVGAILAKLDAESRAEAVAEGARRGLLAL